MNSKSNTVTKEKEREREREKDKDKEKEKEREDEQEKTALDKTKMIEKLKTTAKIKRPVISLKPNPIPKINTTGYETNVTSSSKSPLASNFASEKTFLKIEKKPKESKDDSNLKHKKPLETINADTGKSDKTHRIEKKINLNNNMTDDAEAKNLVNNLAAKKSSNKIAIVANHTSSKKTTEKNHNTNGEKHVINTETNDNTKNKKDSDKNADKTKANEKMKDKKEGKTNTKLTSSNIKFIAKFINVYINN